METDILIIGGGVTGTAIARELSKYNLTITLIEKNSDVATGTSKANSGIIHAGYNASADTMKGILNVKANPLFDKLCKDLKVPFKRNGSLVVGFNNSDLETLKKELNNGEKMGVEGLEIVQGERLREMEPALNPEARYALFAPTAGIISPFELTIALADNAVINGVKILLNTEAKDIVTEDNQIKAVKTNNGIIKAKIVINAAGLFSDEISAMVGENIRIRPRKGEYLLYDKEYGNLVNHVLFPIPSKKSKGILVTPTVHGNLMIGPNSNFIDDKTDLATTSEGFDEIVKGAKKLIPDIPMKGVITSFAGLRAAAESEDFIIKFAKNISGFMNVAGIQSPGLTSSPAIAEYVVDLLKDYLNEIDTGLEINEKADFEETLSENPRFIEYQDDSQNWQKLIENNSDFGEIICRCEKVTKGEILNAIHSPLPAQTVDAVKRRTRAGMGRCQGGFCGPRVVEILAEELNVSPTEVTKRGKNSNILKAKAKELILEKAGE